jgi:hypothetical protein
MEETKPRRQIIIETDGQSIYLIKAEATPLEMVAIFERLLKQLDKS